MFLFLRRQSVCICISWQSTTLNVSFSVQPQLQCFLCELIKYGGKCFLWDWCLPKNVYAVFSFFLFFLNNKFLGMTYWKLLHARHFHSSPIHVPKCICGCLLLLVRKIFFLSPSIFFFLTSLDLIVVGRMFFKSKCPLALGQI